MILVTGASGLIGRYLLTQLKQAGTMARAFDIAHSPFEDIVSPGAVEAALGNIEGVVHLAAVSRVVMAERDPERCWRVNVDGVRQLLAAAIRSPLKPWVVFASSREVYGTADRFPVAEDAPMAPLNHYARAKVEGERMIMEARVAGLCTNIVRLSTVYGCPHDYEDRVVPAFCRAAARGANLTVEGRHVTLDPTYITDVIDGLQRLIEQTRRAIKLPPIHLVSGRGISLLELAKAAICAGSAASNVIEGSPRHYDVRHFVGDPRRAQALLGWQARTPLEDGIAKFVATYRARGESS